MNILEAVENRHSVRKYTKEAIKPEVVQALQEEISRWNQLAGLHIQLITDEPEAFGSFLTHYGQFSNVKNYIAIVGPQGALLDEQAGYCGEQLVLKAQQLGLNTCWVVATYSKKKSRCIVNDGEKRVCVIAVGYGVSSGKVHKSKPLCALCSNQSGSAVPDWFHKGMQAAMLAPTAMNQQKFLITLMPENQVSIKPTGRLYTQIDVGIVKCHFEIGAGKEYFSWV